nr:integrase arm-type DNA-binding domain-containing protein [Serratia fonticola]
MALSDVKVRTAKPEEKAYKLTDGEGMVLLVHPNGSKYWRLRYRFGGKEKMLALGKYPEVSLADARARRDEARKLLAKGIDPSENKKVVKVEQEQEAITFEVVARDWHASNQNWSESHSGRVLKSLEDNLFDTIGKRNIAELKTRDLLTPIKAVEMSGRLEVAARLQQRTTAIMRFAVQSGLIDYNPAQEIAGAVATAKRQHRAALELNRIPELLHRVDKVTQKLVNARLTKLKKTTTDQDELVALTRCLALIKAEASAKKALIAAQGTLGRAVFKHYPTLDEPTIKELVVQGKWLTTLQAGIKAEIERITQQLAERVKELEERYAEPLPALEASVEALSERVAGHLRAMGLEW